MNYKLILGLSVVVTIYSSCLYFNQHDPEMAAIEAIKFAKVAFVEKNFEKAHGLLPTEVDSKFTSEKLKEMIVGMHPADYPYEITATDYEIVPGKKSIYIYLYAENEKEKFYYCLTMGRTSNTDYKVYELYRKMEPYQSSGLRKPLSTKRTTRD